MEGREEGREELNQAMNFSVSEKKKEVAQRFENIVT